MRIGILTFHRSINNGAFVQCYSLSKKLQQLFPDDTVEVIDYHMPLVDKEMYDATVRGRLHGTLRRKISFFVKLPFEIKELQQKKKRKVAFEKALRFLPLSPESFYDDNPSRMFEYVDERYDILIAGSDAIWNFNLRGFPNPYFLKEDGKPIKLAYAASCYGMSYEKIPDGQKKQIKKILDSYKFIGVRDTESELFLQNIRCSIYPLHTCDPTAFLDVHSLPVDKDSFESELIKRGFDFGKKTIGIMGTETMAKMVRKMFGHKYQLVSLYNYNRYCDVNLNDITPLEWAFSFRYFAVTVTTYFHGTLLSLRNGTPVVSIALKTDYSKNHETKVHDVLRRIGLLGNYFETDYKTYNFEPIEAKIAELAESDLRSEIICRMDKEAESSNPFFTCLRSIINCQ